ncbi:hypothetical protein B0H11DRAFT_2254770 [Mycena galericulata]|nr:hypothetical protein B0H11DRAFT_2254770 [Mycena galericulata]
MATSSRAATSVPDDIIILFLLETILPFEEDPASYDYRASCLALVCRRWLQLFESTPRLWSNMFLDNYYSPQYITLRRSRSGVLPLHLHIELYGIVSIAPNERSFRRTSAVLPRLLKSIAPLLDRCRKMCISTSDVASSKAVQIQLPLFIRSDCCVLDMDTVPVLLDGYRPPLHTALRVLRLRTSLLDVPPSTYAFMLEKIHIQHVYSASWPQLFGLLDAAKSLADLTLSDVYCSSFSNPHLASSHRPCTLHTLRRLEVLLNDMTVVHLLTKLVVPNIVLLSCSVSSASLFSAFVSMRPPLLDVIRCISLHINDVPRDLLESLLDAALVGGSH